MMELLPKLQRNLPNWPFLNNIKEQDKTPPDPIEIGNTQDIPPQLTNRTLLQRTPKLFPYRKSIQSSLEAARPIWNLLKKIIFELENEQQTAPKRTKIAKIEARQRKFRRKTSPKIRPKWLQRTQEIEAQHLRKAPPPIIKIFAGAQRLRVGKLLPVVTGSAAAATPDEL